MPAERQARAWRRFAVVAIAVVFADLGIFAWAMTSGRLVVAVVVAANAVVMACLAVRAVERHQQLAAWQLPARSARRWLQ